MMLKYIHRWLSSTIDRYKLSLISDIILIIVSGYLLLKKIVEISITGWLLNNALQQSAVNIFVITSIVIIIFAIIIKILVLWLENFPSLKPVVIEPEHISTCLQVMNNEIVSHINKCNSEEEDVPNIRKLSDQHVFDVNVRLITDSLAEHIRKSFSSIKMKRRDIFISLYSFSNDSKLIYELHYDPKRDVINSKIIQLSSKKFSGYECVKCLKSSNKTAYVLSKDDYIKGSSKRLKTFQQYMGCILETNDHKFGFLNIEFHNKHVFASEDEMQEFMEENIFPFKLLLEYQYLKGEFFSKFKELENNWKV